MHGLCGFISWLLYWWDLRCFTAMQERHQALCCKPHNAEKARQGSKGSSFGSRPCAEQREQGNGDGARGGKGGHEACWLGDALHGAGPGSAKSADRQALSCSSPGSELSSSLDSQLDDLHNALQVLVARPEAQPRLSQVRRMCCTAGNRRKYAMGLQKHTVSRAHGVRTQPACPHVCVRVCARACV